MAAPRKGRPEPLRDILAERITALGWEQRLREEQAVAGWDAAVGPQIAAHARASHIVNRRLVVVTESPVWTQQLALLKPELLRRLARRFGPNVVSELFFVTGKLEARQTVGAPPARPRAPSALPPGLDTGLEGIADPELRESVRRLILASLADDPVL